MKPRVTKGLLESVAVFRDCRPGFDLAKLVESCVDGYRSAHADRRFEYHGPGKPVETMGMPDAIAQALDKLVENAVDFGKREEPIHVALEIRGARAVIAVTNTGPLLPQEGRAPLFDSLVTHRPAAGKSAAHLGLGLYVVRLVAEAHDGRVRAMNLPDGSGVRFEMELLLP